MSKTKITEPSYTTSIFLHIKDDNGNQIHVPFNELEIFRLMMNEKIDEILNMHDVQPKDTKDNPNKA